MRPKFLLLLIISSIVTVVQATCNNQSTCRTILVGCEQICEQCPDGECCLSCLGQYWDTCCDCVNKCDQFRQLEQSDPEHFQNLISLRDQHVKLQGLGQTLDVDGITSISQQNLDPFSTDRPPVHQVSQGVFELDSSSGQTTTQKRDSSSSDLCTYGCWSCSQDCLNNGYRSWCCNRDRCCCSSNPPGQPCHQATHGACQSSKSQCQ